MEPRPVRIYTNKDVPRLRYVAAIILGDILGLSWEIITDKRKLGKSPVINYSPEKVTGSLTIRPHSLLFEEGVRGRDIQVSMWNGLPVFFECSGDSDLPFDIFAASFWLVSRYEEYLAHDPDEHGRFKAAGSLAYRNGFLDIPVVDMWAREFSRVFLRRFPSLVFRRNEYRSLLTVDLDQPYAFLGKGIFRSIGGLINDLKSDATRVTARYHTVAQMESDPFDVYDYIGRQAEANKQEVKYFFPMGDYSKFDKNPSWKNSEYRNLIKVLGKNHKSGLHPSYFSAGSPDKISSERERLESILEKRVNTGRFHFVRLIMPHSYRGLVAAGITEDYSMGYPEEPGFRAGIARPYHFYDVAADKPSNLLIYPFMVMDGTLYQYKKYDCETARDTIMKMISTTRKTGGLFISIWHNTTLLDNDEWRGWREVFEFMLKSQ